MADAKCQYFCNHVTNLQGFIGPKERAAAIVAVPRLGRKFLSASLHDRVFEARGLLENDKDIFRQPSQGVLPGAHSCV